MERLTNYERETIINFNEGENTMSVCTHSAKLRRRLEQLTQERPEECHLHKAGHLGETVEYYIPKSWLKIRPPRILSEEERAARAEIAKRAFSGKSIPSINGVGEGLAAEMGADTPQDLDSEKGA